jgi:hypothetical protein
MLTKICNKCDIEKPLEAYYKHDGCRFGVSSICKDCKSLESTIHYAQNSVRILIKHKEWKSKNKERIRQKRREDYLANRDFVLQQCREYRQLKGLKRWMERYDQDPIFRLRHRISNAMRKMLHGTKANRKWETLVGYTIGELKRHIEKQFTLGMSWNNYGEWHVDHIIPISWWVIRSSNDIAFQMCWALDNLQPLWAVDNLRKGNRYA